MTITVKLFAIVRDLAGVAECMLELPAGASINRAVEQLGERFTALKPHLAKVAYAVNEHYCPANTQLHDGDELAIIPPVSGG